MRNLLIFLLVLLSACSRTVILDKSQPNQSFPSVIGNSLDEKRVRIPEDFKGNNTVLLIGYKQRAQFDIDRWILGILQADVDVKIVEIPTITGMMPQVVQEFIDNGMRSGIPESDWGSVITVYEDADIIVNTIGNERPQSAHVVLLDKDGRIIWKSNIGYSASQVLELKKIVKSLK